MPIEDRFWAQVEKVDGGCWLWTGWLSPDGYGSTSYSARNGERGKAVRVHRFSYMLHLGPIPEGMEIDHDCHNRDADCPGGRCDHRRCVNPSHLLLATPVENNMRGKTFGARNAAKTECGAGHAFTEANTYTTPDGRRQCRACNCERSARHRMKKTGTAEVGVNPEPEGEPDEAAA